MKKKKRFNKKWLKKFIRLVTLFVLGFWAGFVIYLISSIIPDLNVDETPSTQSSMCNKDALSIISTYTKSTTKNFEIKSAPNKVPATTDSEASTVSSQDKSEVTQISEADVSATTSSTVSSPSIVAKPSFEEEHADEIKLLSAIIFAEAGGVSKTHPNEDADLWQQYVGYVVMNRVDSKGFPNSIHDVLYQRGQYDSKTKERVEKGKVTEQSTRNAIIVLKNYYSGQIPVPRNMVFQAEFPQGTSVYVHIGNTYFCCN